MLKASEIAQVTAQFKTVRNRIIEVYPIDYKKELSQSNESKKVPYRAISGNRITYGWLPFSYELSPIEESERISFVMSTEDNAESSKATQNKKKQSFSMYQYVRDNLDKTQEELVNGLNDARKNGVKIRFRGASFDGIVRDYKRKIIKKNKEL